MNKRFCVGCRNDYYNGKNDKGVKECWNLKTAKLVKRIPVGFWQPPPYSLNSVTVPSCYEEEGSNRIIYVKRENLTDQGYWR